MNIKDVGCAVGDLGQIGLLITKKLTARSLADEGDVEPDLVSQLVDRLHPQRIRMRVIEVIEETVTTRTLRMAPLDTGSFPPFRAGQFVNVFLAVDGVSTSRPYSISSPPSRPGRTDITVRKVPDGFVSAYLCERASAGDVFEVSGPAGSFYHEPLVDTDDLVFLAGGSGITPFMSMIRNATELDLNLKIQLIYGCRVPGDVIFGDELAGLACAKNDLKVNIVISEPPDGYEGLCGLLEAPVISGLTGDLSGKTFYLCGPHAMYGLCEGALKSLGVPSRRIKTELSGPPPDITMVEGWPENLKGDEEFQVKIDGTRRKLSAVCGEPLLNSLERNKVVIGSLCRSGECGACRTRLAEGSVFMPASVVMRKADVSFGYIHPCMSYPVSDITIRL